MDKIKCPKDILYEKEWRASYGNRCNAIFLSRQMGDCESMRKLFHQVGCTHKIAPLVEIFWRYYKDHNKEKMLDRVNAVVLGRNGMPDFGQPFYVDERHGKRTLRDWSCLQSFCGENVESPWADLKNYERKETVRIVDEFGSGQSVYYDNKSVAEVLKETVEKTTFLYKQISATGNKGLDLLVRNLCCQNGEKLHIPTYASALRLINNDLTLAFEQKKEPLDSETYVPIIIMLDEMSAEVFNQIDYKQQRTFHKSDLGQEILRFSYLTTQNMYEKNSEYYGFSEIKMNEWLRDIKEIDLWQVAQRKITEDIVERWSRRVRVGSFLNNRMMELATIKSKPKEAMCADYWYDDCKRAAYLNLYIKSQNNR